MSKALNNEQGKKTTLGPSLTKEYFIGALTCTNTTRVGRSLGQNTDLHFQDYVVDINATRHN